MNKQSMQQLNHFFFFSFFRYSL